MEQIKDLFCTGNVWVIALIADSLFGIIAVYYRRKYIAKKKAKRELEGADDEQRAA